MIAFGTGSPADGRRRAGAWLAGVVCVLLWTAPGAPAKAAETAGERIVKAIVGISTVVPEDARTAGSLGTIRSGSGIVIDDNGLVLTIGYLMMEAAAAAVTDADGVLVRASLVAYDHATGFGLLRANRPLGIQPVELGSSNDLREGAPVIVVSKGGPAPVLPAQVSSRREFVGYWEYLLDKAIFTVPPHPQYGGAALIDQQGKLVGVGSLAVHDAVPGERSIPGNMFVPIDILKPVLAELVEHGRAKAPPQPWLGIYTDETRGRVFVTRVAVDGPGEAAGIKPGDIIMGVGGKRVGGMADFLRKVWARGDAGVEVPIDVISAGSGSLDIRTIKVVSRDRHTWLKLNRGF